MFKSKAASYQGKSEGKVRKFESKPWKCAIVIIAVCNVLKAKYCLFVSASCASHSYAADESCVGKGIVLWLLCHLSYCMSSTVCSKLVLVHRVVWLSVSAESEMFVWILALNCLSNGLV